MDNEKDPADIESEPDGPISPFSPYHELLVNIKSSLISTRKKGTHVRVRTPFILSLIICMYMYMYNPFTVLF